MFRDFLKVVKTRKKAYKIFTKGDPGEIVHMCTSVLSAIASVCVDPENQMPFLEGINQEINFKMNEEKRKEI